jgi:NAD(P)H-hydrate repair Nnr-like enzyme with NAD(P)H-hydrate dehydratase domain
VAGYWKQQRDKPLYPDLLWSKPVTKRGAGKLLIIGGSSAGFSVVARSFAGSSAAGAGHVRAVVPDSLRKITHGFDFIEYAPSNPSGGFAKTSLAELLELAGWSDGVLIAGDLGKNSETSLLIEQFMQTCPKTMIIATNALTTITLDASDILSSDQRVVMFTHRDIQNAARELKVLQPITSTQAPPQFAQSLKEVSESCRSFVMVVDNQTLWVTHQGEVISTTSSQNENIAPLAAVWALQNPTKIKEALACACWETK